GGNLACGRRGVATYTSRDLTPEEFAADRKYEAILELKAGGGVFSSLLKVKLTSIAPRSAWLINRGSKPEQRSAKSGVGGQRCVGPADVSFKNVQLKETRGTMTCWGQGMSAGRGRIHQDTPQWLPGREVTDQGTLMNALDEVWSLADPGQQWVADPTQAMIKGQDTWDIAWMYTLAGSGEATGYQFAKVPHIATLWSDGKMKVEKGG